MAHATTYSNSSQFRDLAKRIGSKIAAGLESYAHRRCRIDAIQALQAKSDRELADLGISRDRIHHHVFRDLMY